VLALVLLVSGAAMAQNEDKKGEYLYTDFGDATVKSTNFNLNGTPTPAQIFTHSTNLFGHQIRAGINYIF
jgi:opacity protein-like surface antigen